MVTLIVVVAIIAALSCMARVPQRRAVFADDICFGVSGGDPDPALCVPAL